MSFVSGFNLFKNNDSYYLNIRSQPASKAFLEFNTQQKKAGKFGWEIAPWVKNENKWPNYRKGGCIRLFFDPPNNNVKNELRECSKEINNPYIFQQRIEIIKTDQWPGVSKICLLICASEHSPLQSNFNQGFPLAMVLGVRKEKRNPIIGPLPETGKIPGIHCPFEDRFIQINSEASYHIPTRYFTLNELPNDLKNQLSDLPKRFSLQKEKNSNFFYLNFPLGTGLDVFLNLKRNKILPQNWSLAEGISGKSSSNAGAHITFCKQEKFEKLDENLQAELMNLIGTEIEVGSPTHIEIKEVFTSAKSNFTHLCSLIFPENDLIKQFYPYPPHVRIAVVYKDRLLQ